MSTKIVEAQTLSGFECPILLTIFRGGSKHFKSLSQRTVDRGEGGRFSE
jgi:hypothetical protein